jgi:hypothetical protein
MIQTITLKRLFSIPAQYFSYFVGAEGEGIISFQEKLSKRQNEIKKKKEKKAIKHST